uniref:DUF1758 domain-containing protein n=1 Tax=Heterorhabditis bacteriophora TaxID=37862 RepID=A0A1I7X9H0_HETBA
MENAQQLPIKIHYPYLNITKPRKHLRLILENASEKTVRTLTESENSECITTMATSKRNTKLNSRQGGLVKYLIKMFIRGRPSRGSQSSKNCQYCDGAHRSRDCTKFETSQRKGVHAREHSTIENTIALMMVEVYIVNPVTQEMVSVLAFFDTGSQVLFITNKLVNTLDIPEAPVGTVNIAGFNGNIFRVPFLNCSIGILNTDGNMRMINTHYVPTIAHDLQVDRFTRTANSLTTTLCTQLIVDVSDKERQSKFLKNPCAEEDDAVWTHFKNTYRNKNGRYAVSLTIRNPDAEILSNEGFAIEQLLQLKNGLNKKPHIATEIRRFVDE